MVVVYPTVGGLSGIFLRRAPNFVLKDGSVVAVFISKGRIFQSLTARILNELSSAVDVAAVAVAFRGG